MKGRIKLFGMHIDALRMDQTVSTILDWIDTVGAPCRYVVTPNVHHVEEFQQSAGLRRAYAKASLIVADGTPVVWASRWLGRPLPERVAGSDLVPAIFDAGQERGDLSVFLLGAAPGVGIRAAEYIKRTWPDIQVAGVYSPPFGFETRKNENRKILKIIRESGPDLLIVGLGAPKQEIWVYEHLDHIDARVALCVGATIDFLAGERVRAPLWMQNVGLEWFHRMLSNPRRLFMRYARGFIVFSRLLWNEWRALRS